MKALREYVRKYLINNKRRTALSISAITIATALIFTVLTLAYNAYQSINTSISQSTGNYHVVFYNVSDEFESYMNHNVKIDNIGKVARLGSISVKESKNEDKPYLNLQGYNEQAFENLGIELLEGRYPENEHEIIISEAILNEAKLKYELNDTVEFIIGKRMLTGTEIDDYDRYHYLEQLIPQRSASFTIVGIFESNLLDINSAAYSILTYYSEVSSFSHDYYLRLKDPREAEKTIHQLMTLFENEYASMDVNEKLLTYSNLFSASYVQPSILYFLVGLILAFIIMLLLLVYHAFASSYANREKHLAILKSVGITQHQMKMMVFYEGLLILIIALPLGAIIGSIFTRFSITYINDLLADTSANMIQIQYDHMFIFGLGSILTVSFASLISIQIAARRASRQSISMTLRDSDELPKDKPYLNLNKKHPPIILQLIQKGIQQNKKAYRIIMFYVVSVLTLLITFSSMMAYLNESGIVDVNEHNYDVRVKIENDEYPTPLMTRLKLIEPARSLLLSESLFITINDLEGFNSDYINQYLDPELNQITFELIAYNDKVLETYVYKNQLLTQRNISKLYDTENMTGILINQVYNSAEKRFFDVYELDVLHHWQINGQSFTNLNLLKCSDLIMGLSLRDTVQILVSHDVMNAILSQLPSQYMHTYYAHYQTSNPDSLVRNIHMLVDSDIVKDFDVINATASLKEGRTITLLIEVLFYGYLISLSLMGIFVSFCIASTNFEYRKYEFVLYRIVGLRMKDVFKMLLAELLYFAGKCLLITTPFALFANYLGFILFFESNGLKYYIPKKLLIWLYILCFAFCVLASLYASWRIRKCSMRSVSKNEIALF